MTIGRGYTIWLSQPVILRFAILQSVIIVDNVDKLTQLRTKVQNGYKKEDWNKFSSLEKCCVTPGKCCVTLDKHLNVCYSRYINRRGGVV